MEYVLVNPFLIFYKLMRHICLAVYMPSLKLISANSGRSDVRDKQNEELKDIMGKYGNKILRLAYSYLHNMEDSEDILQEVLIKYIEKKPVLENNEHLKAWLLKVASNLSKNKIEYNKVRETDELNEELVAEEREDLSFVWEAVKTLPDKYREVIHLFYEEGYQTDEIAKILEVSSENVRTRLKRARTKLKEILKEEYDFYE